MAPVPLSETDITHIRTLFNYCVETGLIRRARESLTRNNAYASLPLNTTTTARVVLESGRVINLPITRLAWILSRHRTPLGRITLRSKEPDPEFGLNLRPDNLRDCGSDVQHPALT